MSPGELILWAVLKKKTILMSSFLIATTEVHCKWSLPVIDVHSSNTSIAGCCVECWESELGMYLPVPVVCSSRERYCGWNLL